MAFGVITASCRSEAFIECSYLAGCASPRFAHKTRRPGLVVKVLLLFSVVHHIDGVCEDQCAGGRRPSTFWNATRPFVNGSELS